MNTLADEIRARFAEIPLAAGVCGGPRVGDRQLDSYRAESREKMQTDRRLEPTDAIGILSVSDTFEIVATIHQSAVEVKNGAKRPCPFDRRAASDELVALALGVFRIDRR